MDKLHRETTKALGDPVVKEKLSGLGTEARTMSVDEFTKFVRDDVLGTVKLAKDANLTPTNRAGGSRASDCAHGDRLAFYGLTRPLGLLVLAGGILSRSLRRRPSPPQAARTP